MGVGFKAISRMGTLTSGRLPLTYTFREFGNGCMEASLTFAVLPRNLSGIALMVLILFVIDERLKYDDGRWAFYRSFPTPVQAGSGSKGLISAPRVTVNG